MEDPRPLKRARQACEPCRRKKSKCPGEKPACSYCVRLGQHCLYAMGEPGEDTQSRPNKRLEDRMDGLENKLDQLLHHLQSGAASPPAPGVPARLPMSNDSSSTPANLHVRSGRPQARGPGDLVHSAEEEQLFETGKLYLTWCHRQPVALFQTEGFVESLKTRDREVILALQVICIRFAPAARQHHHAERLENMAAHARRLVMERLARSKVELSTLQTLCLLSMSDFAAGRPAQGGMNLSIASNLIQSLIGSGGNETTELADCDELRSCIASVATLQNLQGPVRLAAQPFPPSPPYDIRLDRSRAYTRTTAPQTNSSAKDSGDDILTFVAELAEVWSLARSYAMYRPDTDTPPPWTPQSDYSVVMQRHLDIDSKVPLKYRWQENKFEECEPEILQQHRDYWGPWLCLQFVYAAIPCLLNHPFLLSMRLRNFRRTMPHSFIQQSFEQITRHAGWISHFLDLLEMKDFVVSDPTLAHCVVIVATIHLQHTFVSDPVLRDKACAGLEKCMRFLRKLGTMWQNVEIMAANLEKLQESMVTAMAPGGNQTEPAQDNTENRSIDASLLWDLLIYENAGLARSTLASSMFGDTLLQKRVEAAQSSPSSQASDTAFDLMGSAGIYGHKTVPKETPFYPPNDHGTPLGKADYLNEHAHLMPAFGGGAVNGSEGQDSLFLFANEYGRSLETWLDFDAL